MQEVIRATGLRKRYGSMVAVDGVDFDIRQGECFGFLGPNGAGKTSTVKMIHCFSPVSEGELQVFGLSVRRDQRAIKSRIGVCQQEETLDPDFSVLKGLLVFARYFGIPGGTAYERARELLEFMGLWDRRDDGIRELSGGLKRRLVIARALINDPDLLILDEPTTGLDPQSRHLVRDRIRTLRRPGLVQHVKSRGWSFETDSDRLYLYVERGGDALAEITARFATERCMVRPAGLEDLFLRLTGRELRE